MQPSISELTHRFLRQAPAEAATSEVELYDVATAFSVEPRAAWLETLTVLKLLGASSPMPKMPADWAVSVRQHSPVRLLPMALGHYPQQVSELSLLLKARTAEPISIPHSNAIAALKSVVSSKEDASMNEVAMKHWNAGEISEASREWAKIASPAIRSFNLGVAWLALNNTASAQAELTQAIALLPKDSGWYALAELYLAMASVK